MTTKFLFSLLFTTLFFASAAQAGNVEILKSYRNRDWTSEVHFELNADGKSCTRSDYAGQYRMSMTRKQENGPACTALKIARRIQKSVGGCGEQNVGETILTGRDGVLFANPHTIFKSGTQQECLCGKFVTAEGDTGWGSLNLLARVADGAYWWAQKTMFVVSAQECAGFFSTKAEKAAVYEAYRAYGF